MRYEKHIISPTLLASRRFVSSLSEYTPSYSPADLDAVAEACRAAPTGTYVAFCNNRLIRNKNGEAKIFGTYDAAVTEMMLPAYRPVLQQDFIAVPPLVSLNYAA